MSELDPQALADELVKRLKAHGVPEGTWLVEIAEVRRALQDADRLLRRLEDAITEQAGSAAADPAPPLPEP
jgi:hypothetical protein